MVAETSWGAGPEHLRDRLERVREEAAAAVSRLEVSLAELRATQQRLAAGRPRRERLHDSVIARLQARLESQPVIEQAKGILMARGGCGPEEAFDILRRASQRSNVPVRELAEEIVAQAASGAHRPIRS
jgi:AmiR/NasT family two-component response regulator